MPPNDPIPNPFQALDTVLATISEGPPDVSGDLSDQEVITQRTILVEIHFRVWGIRRKIPGTNTNVDYSDADRKLMQSRKKLLECKEYDRIMAQEDRVRSFLEQRTLECDLGRSFHLLPLSLVNAVQARLQTFKEEREQLVETFLEAYPEEVERSKGRLGVFFNQQDYPSIAVLGQKFGLDWRYRSTVEAPASLGEINQELLAQQRAQLGEDCRTIVAGAESFVTETMQKLVDELANALTLHDSQQRRFQHTTVDKLTDWLQLLNDLNINDNQTIKSLGERAQSLLEGKDAQWLRDNELGRHVVRDRLTEIGAELRNHTTVVHRRLRLSA